MATQPHLAAVKVGSNVTVSWTGGAPPFQLWQTNVLVPPAWFRLGLPTMVTSKTLPINPGPAAQAYFRLEHDIPLLDVNLDAPNTQLMWLVPELA